MDPVSTVNCSRASFHFHLGISNALLRVPYLAKDAASPIATPTDERASVPSHEQPASASPAAPAAERSMIDSESHQPADPAPGENSARPEERKTDDLSAVKVGKEMTGDDTSQDYMPGIGPNKRNDASGPPEIPKAKACNYAIMSIFLTRHETDVFLQKRKISSAAMSSTLPGDDVESPYPRLRDHPHRKNKDGVRTSPGLPFL